MTDQTNRPPDGRFKADMPQIPGVVAAPRKTSGPSSRLLVLIGLASVLIAVFVGFKLLAKPHRPTTAASAQVDASPPAPDLSPSLPVAAERIPGIARVGDLAKPWDSLQFTFLNQSSHQNVTGILVRLPTGSPSQASGYWAFTSKAPFGECQLEFVRELAKLRNDYGLRQASHPMAANPCSRTLFDPLKYGSISGDALARGAIVQGSDLRPPFGIEIQVRGRDIFAIRTE